MQEWFNSVIEWLLEMTQFQGALILLVTVPLTIIQGIFTLFPFSNPPVSPKVATCTIIREMHIWLIGLISSALFEQDIKTQWWWMYYIIFCLVLLGLFFIQVKKRRKEKQIGL